MNDELDFGVFVQNIAELLPSIYSVLGVIFMVIAFGMAFSAIVDFAQAGEKNKKYLGTHQASAVSGLIKLIIAGALANFASHGQAGAILSSMFFDHNSFTLISIDSYVGNESENHVQKLTKIVIIGMTQVVGLIGIFKGLRIWAKASDRSGKESAWHGLNYLIFGTLCIQVAQVMGVINNTIGFNFFKMIGLA